MIIIIIMIIIVIVIVIVMIGWLACRLPAHLQELCFAVECVIMSILFYCGCLCSLFVWFVLSAAFLQEWPENESDL